MSSLNNSQLLNQFTNLIENASTEVPTDRQEMVKQKYQIFFHAVKMGERIMKIDADKAKIICYRATRDLLEFIRINLHIQSRFIKDIIFWIKKIDGLITENLNQENQTVGSIVNKMA